MTTPQSVQTPTHRSAYQLPTRFQLEDQLITVGFFSLSLRQALVLSLFGCLGVSIWRTFDAWLNLGVIGAILRWGTLALIALVGLLWTFVRIADRTLEDWCLVLLRFWCLPKRYRWSSVSGLRWRPPASASRSLHQEDEEIFPRS